MSLHLKISVAFAFVCSALMMHFHLPYHLLYSSPLQLYGVFGLIALGLAIVKLNSRTDYVDEQSAHAVMLSLAVFQSWMSFGLFNATGFLYATAISSAFAGLMFLCFFVASSFALGGLRYLQKLHLQAAP